MNYGMCLIVVFTNSGKGQKDVTKMTKWAEFQFPPINLWSMPKIRGEYHKINIDEYKKTYIIYHEFTTKQTGVNRNEKKCIQECIQDNDKWKDSNP